MRSKLVAEARSQGGAASGYVVDALGEAFLSNREGSVSRQRLEGKATGKTAAEKTTERRREEGSEGEGPGGCDDGCGLCCTPAAPCRPWSASQYSSCPLASTMT